MDPKENNQVIIFKNDDDDGKRHFTWSDYCHFTYIFKYWVLGITLIFAIIGYLVVSLWWNPNHSVSNARVTVEMPVSIVRDANGATTDIYFLDGSTRYSMYDIISRENIESVVENTKDKDGNLVFAGVDVDNLLKSNGISIQTQTETRYDGSTSYEAPTDAGDLKYVITINGKYIGDSDTTSDFIEALINNVIDKAISLVPSQYLDFQIPDYYQSLDLDVLLNQISNQYNAINSLYQSLLSRFQETDTITLTGSSTATTLRSVYYDFQQQYLAASGAETEFAYLESLLSLNHYVRFTIGEEQTAIQTCMNNGDILIDRLEKSAKLANQASKNIENLLKPFSPDVTIGALDSSIQEKYAIYAQNLSDALASIDNILEDLRDLGYQCTLTDTDTFDYVVTLPDYTQMDEADYGTIQHLQNPNDDEWKQACSAFIAKVDALVPQLNDSVTKANEVYKGLYSSEETGIIWMDASHIVTDGEISAFLGAAAGLVLGFILSSAILAAYGYIKEKKGIPVLADGSETTSTALTPTMNNTPEETKEEPTQEETPEKQDKETTDSVTEETKDQKEESSTETSDNVQKDETKE